jgi:hypothetical protein
MAMFPGFNLPFLSTVVLNLSKRMMKSVRRWLLSHQPFRTGNTFGRVRFKV